MIRFEEHEGQLFRMLEEPVPLTPDAEMPCLVRLIQDDSPMGKFNKDLHAVDPKRLMPKICTEVIDVNDLSDHNRGSVRYDGFISFLYYHYELIGTPVVEGSREWALWKILNGEMVHRSGFPYKALNGKIYCTNSAGEIYPATSYQLWLENKAKDGWKIYKEPEPQYKVGDWVEHEKSKEQGRITYISSDNYDAIDVKLYDQDELERYTKSDFNADFRKLSPSEVIVHIGCLSGTVRRINDIYFALNPSSKAGWVVPEASIPHAMLDTNTRSLVESLLEAQEEEE